MSVSPLTQLDESKDFEERKMIRAAMRDLRKRKRGNSIKKTSLLSLSLGPHESSFPPLHFLSDCCLPSNTERQTCCLIRIMSFNSHFLPLMIINTISACSFIHLKRSILPSEVMLGCTQEEIGRAGWCAVCIRG